MMLRAGRYRLPTQAETCASVRGPHPQASLRVKVFLLSTPPQRTHSIRPRTQRQT